MAYEKKICPMCNSEYMGYSHEEFPKELSGGHIVHSRVEEDEWNNLSDEDKAKALKNRRPLADSGIPGAIPFPVTAEGTMENPGIPKDPHPEAGAMRAGEENLAKFGPSEPSNSAPTLHTDNLGHRDALGATQGPTQSESLAGSPGTIRTGPDIK